MAWCLETWRCPLWQHRSDSVAAWALETQLSGPVEATRLDRGSCVTGFAREAWQPSLLRTCHRGALARQHTPCDQTAEHPVVRRQNAPALNCKKSRRASAEARLREQELPTLPDAACQEKISARLCRRAARRNVGLHGHKLGQRPLRCHNHQGRSGGPAAVPLAVCRHCALLCRSPRQGSTAALQIGQLSCACTPHECACAIDEFVALCSTQSTPEREQSKQQGYCISLLMTQKHTW